MRRSAVALETLRSMLARVPHPYEGADPFASRRVTAALVGLNSLVMVAFLAIDRPTHAIGQVGWLVAVAVVASSAGAVPRLVGSGRQAGFNELLAIAYAGAAGIALVQWLAGPESPYNLLLVLWLGTGAVHPPRRALTYLGVLIAITWLPVVYGDGDAMLVAHAAALALLLLSIGAVLVTYLFTVRRQRLGLQAGVEVARRLARSDPLTGLGNRRAFDEALTVEIARTERSGEPLTVGLVDLDGLKRINDRFGHLEGDRCLCSRARDRALAALLGRLLSLGRRRVRGAASAHGSRRRVAPARARERRGGADLPGARRRQRRAVLRRRRARAGGRRRGPSRPGRPRAPRPEDREAPLAGRRDGLSAERRAPAAGRSAERRGRGDGLSAEPAHVGASRSSASGRSMPAAA
jgi:hypothetical protein